MSLLNSAKIYAKGNFMQSTATRNVYIVDGSRTPFLKAAGKPGPFSASDLAVATGKILLERTPFDAQSIDEVIMGCVMPREYEANIARIIALRLGCGQQTPAWTVQRNCASGMEAVDNAWKNIQQGRANLVLAGGTEAMSHAPLVWQDEMVHWLAGWARAKSLVQRVKLLSQLRPGYFRPVIALLCGLTDPVVNLSMGQTAENLAYQYEITREAMDAFALQSHQRVAHAEDEAHLEEITPLYDVHGNYYPHDTGVRHDTSLEKLAKLKPFFDKKFGKVTAGNSSQITDGAAVMIIASEEAVKQHQLPVLAKIVGCAWAAIDPAVMGIAPIYATSRLLSQQGKSMDEIDYWEINEAFAAQVLSCQKAAQDATFCQQELGLSQALGRIDIEKLNIDGGAVALGHPVGASGARIILHLAHVLQRKRAKYGVATLCVGGGQGGAMLLERV
jgi:acetyl-CoA C-acetyltransferase